MEGGRERRGREREGEGVRDEGKWREEGSDGEGGSDGGMVQHQQRGCFTFTLREIT